MTDCSIIGQNRSSPFVIEAFYLFQAQENCLESIGEHATSTAGFLPIFVKIIHFLYDEDILSEEAILEWSVFVV